VQGEAELGRDVQDAALGERAGGVPYRSQHLGRRPFDLREVVVPLPHVRAELRVRPPGHLGRRALLGEQPGQLAVQPDQRLERVRGQPPAGPHHGQAQRRVPGRGLEVRQLDLQARAPARRLRAEQIVHRYAESARDRPQHAQFRLALAVLDERELRRRPADGLAQLLQRQPPRPAQVAQALAQRDEIH
jgi:hypothetical protein